MIKSTKCRRLVLIRCLVTVSFRAIAATMACQDEVCSLGFLAHQVHGFHTQRYRGDIQYALNGGIVVRIGHQSQTGCASPIFGAFEKRKPLANCRVFVSSSVASSATTTGHLSDTIRQHHPCGTSCSQYCFMREPITGLLSCSLKAA